MGQTSETCHPGFNVFGRKAERAANRVGRAGILMIMRSGKGCILAQIKSGNLLAFAIFRQEPFMGKHHPSRAG